MDYIGLKHDDGNYVEAIKDGEIVRVEEKIAILEDLFILRKIGGSQNSSSVSPPLQSSAIKSKEPILKNNSIMSDWKHGKFGGKKNNAAQDLISNFNWEISKNRKAKNMTRLKLAQMINATEDQVKMLELGELPVDDFVLISRIEQVFGINLRKNPGSIAHVSLADLQKRNEEKRHERSQTNVFKDSTNLAGNDIEILD